MFGTGLHHEVRPCVPSYCGGGLPKVFRRCISPRGKLGRCRLSGSIELTDLLIFTSMCRRHPSRDSRPPEPGLGRTAPRKVAGSQGCVRRAYCPWASTFGPSAFLRFLLLVVVTVLSDDSTTGCVDSLQARTGGSIDAVIFYLNDECQNLLSFIEDATASCSSGYCTYYSTTNSIHYGGTGGSLGAATSISSGDYITAVTWGHTSSYLGASVSFSLKSGSTVSFSGSSTGSGNMIVPSFCPDS